MIDRVKQWFASGPRDDTAEIQAEAARIRAGWAASKPPAPVRSLVPAATTAPGGIVALPHGVSPQNAVMPIQRATIAAGTYCSTQYAGYGGGGGAGYISASYMPLRPGHAHWVTMSTTPSFATNGITWYGADPMPIDPIYTIPPTQQWREQYTHALDAAKYARVVREE